MNKFWMRTVSNLSLLQITSKICFLVVKPIRKNEIVRYNNICYYGIGVVIGEKFQNTIQSFFYFLEDIDLHTGWRVRNDSSDSMGSKEARLVQ